MQRAILIMFVAMSLIPAGDSAGKVLTSQLGVAPIFVAWSRFAFGLLMLLPFLPGNTLRLLRDWRVWLRAILLAGGISGMQIALRTEPVATVFAAFFIGPLLSYIFAALLLREQVSPLRSVLIALGFCGVLLVVRPGGDMGPGLIAAVVAGMFYGAFLTMSRWIGGIGHPLSLTFTQLGIAALLTLPLGLTSLPTFSLPIAALTLTSAACSMLGNLLLLFAYRLAPASRLAPLVYFQLIAAVGLGWSVFGTLPDAATWAGLTLIIGTGLMSARLR
jgi:drug/metabolite transporter (DMT)-like permease